MSFTQAPKYVTAALRSLLLLPHINTIFLLFCFETPCYTHPSPPPHGGFPILLSTRSSLVAMSQPRQKLCFPATLTAMPSNGHPAIPIRLQTIKKSNTSDPLCQFPSVSHTDQRVLL
ncbi:hypothetical protein AVEN_86449-1 [Araneus ventricosus]|uniref:Uncharacterized protein n=1 Tax=Araneus ventricosus TaxID=182803 RepID=A0A4Y2KFT7_ARAVE|nr:hypothetical protein AVEN_86449-1 [Araneus ventricosus]